MNETLIFWILGGFGSILLILATWIRAHEKTCNVRWDTFLQEHGRLQANVEQLLKHTNRR